MDFNSVATEKEINGKKVITTNVALRWMYVGCKVGTSNANFGSTSVDVRRMEEEIKRKKNKNLSPPRG